MDSYQCEEKVNDIEASIPLAWTNVPEEATSLAVTMVHYPNPDDLTQPNCYLILWDINPTSISSIAHGEADAGPFFIGSNKDNTAVSYTSPCSPSTGSHEYTITLYALSETPDSLPQESTVNVTYDILMSAIENVTIISTASITFDSVTE